MFAQIEPILTALAVFAKGYTTGVVIASVVFLAGTASVLAIAALQAYTSGAWITTTVFAAIFTLACVPLFGWAALTLPAFLAAAAIVERQRFATSVVEAVETEFLAAPDAGRPVNLTREDVTRFRGGFDQLAQQVAAKAPWGMRAVANWVTRRTIGVIGDYATKAVLAEFKAGGGCTLPGSVAQYCGRFIDRLTASYLRAFYWRGTVIAAAIWTLAAGATIFFPANAASR